MKEYITFIKEKRNTEVNLNNSNIKSENVFNAETIFLPSDNEKASRKNINSKNNSDKKPENHNNNENEQKNSEYEEYDSENNEKDDCNSDSEEAEQEEGEEEEEEEGETKTEKDVCDTKKVGEEIDLKNIILIDNSKILKEKEKSEIPEEGSYI